MNSINSQNWGS